MADVALTQIQHGTKDGVIVIEQGMPVKGLSADVVEALKEAGAVGPAVPTIQEADEANAEREDLLAQVEELKAKLALATKKDDPATPAPKP